MATNDGAQCDPYQQVNEALTALRATYGRLPELDTIEISCARTRAELGQLRVVVDAIRGCLSSTS